LSSANNGNNDTCTQTVACYRDKFYAGTKNHGIFRSTDNGENWIQLINGLSDSNVLSLYTCGVNVFAGTLGGGFYMSPDNGLTWSKYNGDLVKYNVQSIMENGNDVFIGTHYGGLWKRSLSEIPLTFSFKNIKLSPREICASSACNIQVEVVGGNPPYNFLWSNGMQSSSIIVEPLTTTTYSVTVTDNNLESITEDVTVRVNPKPETPLIYQHGDTLISSSPDGNRWILNNQTVVYTDSNVFVPTYNGNYTVVVVKKGCVSDTSNAVYLGIDQFLTDESISIYPNPSGGKIIVEILLPVQEYNLKIYNLNGQETIEKQIREDKTKIDINDLAQGVYFIKLTFDEFVGVKKIIKY